MNTVIENFNTSMNFWTSNPNMLVVAKFKDLYDKDKSKNREDSSRLMWAISLYCDLNDKNPWRNMPDREKKMLIKEDYLRDKKFDWEDKLIKDLIHVYTELVLSVPEKALRNFNLKLIERQTFIDNTKYDMENADQLDKMMLNTSKIYSQYEEILHMFKEEKNSGKTKGGIKESASEQGLI